MFGLNVFGQTSKQRRTMSRRQRRFKRSYNRAARVMARRRGDLLSTNRF